MHCRQFLIAIISMLLTGATFAQQAPPAAYGSGTKVNYVRSWLLKSPETNAANVSAKNVTDAQQTTTYIDGLGRPVQTVVKAGSFPSDGIASDLVSPVLYDQYGREQFKYLGFGANNAEGNTSLSDGQFKLNAFKQQATFMDSQFNGQGETYFYSKSVFETSPLNRVTETFAPGNSWVGTSDMPLAPDRRSVKMNYLFNTSIDAVRIWKVLDDVTLGNFGSYSTDAGTAGIYPAGQLYKNITTDEHGKQVIEFKNKSGQVILKKVQLTATADDGSGKNHDGWICTYYIYDDFDNLRAVIQPVGVNELARTGGLNWILNTTLLNEQCFRYEYDQRRRMIVKKVPGAAEVYMVYDNRDRLVATSDGNGRSGAYTGYCYWMFTLYDALNRPVVTGEMHSCLGWAAMQAHANGLNRTNETINLQPYITTSVTVFNPILGNASIAGSSILSNWYANSVTYYDSYTWVTALGDWRIEPTIDPYNFSDPTYFVTTVNTAPWYVQPLIANYQVKGMLTGTRTRVLNSTSANGAWQTAVSFYDENGRVLQSNSTSREGGYSRITTQYDFAGRVHRVVYKEYSGGITDRTTYLRTRYEYDALGRLSKTYKRIGVEEQETMLSELQYDALGMVKTKKLGQKKNVSGVYVANDPIESMSYDYNIRGWLLGINRQFVTNVNSGAPDAGKWFGFDLGYEKRPNASGNDYSVGNEQFNGNISGQSWRSAGDNAGRQYRFSYDAANRLLKADFVQKRNIPTETTWGKTFNYDSWMGDGNTAPSAYDLNGNIKQMQQWGWTAGNTNTPIDNLTYTYQNNGLSNRLRAVGDDKTPPARLGDFTNKSNTADDYGYDVNGNLITDLNKRLNGTTGSNLTTGGAIAYNHLNLPSVINVKNDNGTAKGTITYTYDAAGNKLKKQTVDQSVSGKTITTTTHYIGAFVYESRTTLPADASNPDYIDKLLFVNHEEGRIRILYDNTTQPYGYINCAYDYFLKDHLGNVRMVLTDEIKSDVYPTLSFEGAAGSADINNQNAVWEKPNGQPFDVFADRDSSSAVLINSGLQPPPLSKSLLVRSSFGKIGAAKLIKVMAGDKINTSVQYYYPTTSGSGSGTGLNTLVTSLASVLANSIGSGALLKGAGTTLASGVTADPQAVNFFNNQNNTPAAGKPKAYLNVLFFDEQFKLDSAASKYQQVGTGTMTPGNPGQIGFMAGSAVLAQKSGYCYIYISNESDELVYFDNLTLTHDKSSLMEETHYYPFGLVMAGISSKAAGKGLDCGCGNKKGYNGNEIQSKEFTDGSGLELYDFNARTYDQQIGRFIQIDPMTDEGGQESLSPYHFSYNNPVTYNDPDGKFPVFLIPIIAEALKVAAVATVSYIAAKEVAPVVTGAIQNTKLPRIPAPSFDANAFIPLSAQMAKANSEKQLEDASNDKGGTYVLKDKNDKVARSGRTNDLQRREKEHARGEETKDKTFEIDLKTDDKKVQRGREQQLHETHNPPLNKIKPIADKNPKKPAYMQALQDFLDKAIKGQ